VEGEGGGAGVVRTSVENGDSTSDQRERLIWYGAHFPTETHTRSFACV
jgi:hypothetical protein